MLLSTRAHVTTGMQQSGIKKCTLGVHFLILDIIHDVYRRAFNKGFDIFFGHIHYPLPCLFGCPADMRRYNAVFRLQQRIIAFYRLCGHNIDRCGIDLSGVERVSEVFLDNKSAAAVIDNKFLAIFIFSFDIPSDLPESYPELYPEL